MELSINDFEEPTMKLEYTRYGTNIQPVVSWNNVPENAVELVLLCYDPDAKPLCGKTWLHWFVYGIDPTTKTLVNTKYVVGLNDFKNTVYDGPQPPNDVPHNYHFTLYTLNKKTSFEVSKRLGFEQIYDAIRDSVISIVEIVKPFQKPN